MRAAGGRKFGGGGGGSPQADLLKWCQKMTEGYPGVNIANFHVSWRDGLGFCALVHRYAPSALNFESLDPKNILDNNQLAFDAGFTHLGIPKLLDAEDMLLETPERFSIMTYLLQFYRTVADKGAPPPLAVGSPSKPTGGAALTPSAPSGTTGSGQSSTPQATNNPTPPASTQQPVATTEPQTVLSPSQLLRIQREQGKAPTNTASPASSNPTNPLSSSGNANRPLMKSSKAVPTVSNPTQPSPQKQPDSASPPSEGPRTRRKTITSPPPAFSGEQTTPREHPVTPVQEVSEPTKTEDQPQEDLDDEMTDANDIGMVTALKHLMRCYLREQEEGIVDAERFKAALKEVDDAHNLFQKSGRRSASTSEIEEDRDMLLQAFDECQTNFKELKEMIAQKAPTEDVQLAAYELNSSIDDILGFIFGDDIIPIDEEEEELDPEALAEQLAEALDVIEQLEDKVNQSSSQITELEEQIQSQKKEIEELKSTKTVPPSSLKTSASNQELDSLKKKCEELENKLKVANNAIMTSNNYFTELQEELSLAKKELAEANTKHQATQAQLEELKKKESSSSSSTELETFKKRHEEAVKDYEDRLKAANNAIQVSNDYFTELQQEVSDAKKQLIEANLAHAKELPALVKKTQEACQQQQVELENQWKEEKSQLEKRLADANAAVLSSNDYFTELQDELSQSKKQASEMEANFKKQIQELQLQLEQSKKENQTANEQSSKLVQSELAQLQISFKETEAKLLESQAKQQELSHQLNEANQTIGLLEEERVLLEDDIKNKTEAAKKSQAKLDGIAALLSS